MTNANIAMLNKEAENYIKKAQRINNFTSTLTRYIEDRTITDDETINCAIAWFNHNPQMSPVECILCALGY